MHDKLSVILDCLKKKKTLKMAKLQNLQEINIAKQNMADIQNQHWLLRDLDSTRKERLENIFQAFLDTVDTSQ